MEDRRSILGKDRGFSRCQSVQVGSGPQMGTGDSIPGDKTAEAWSFTFIPSYVFMADHSGRAVFAFSKTGLVGSNPTRDMDVCVFILCLCCSVYK
jgi:hypothetical protein